MKRHFPLDSPGCRPASRRGVSLVEAVAVMTANAALMAAAIAALVAIQQADRHVSQQFENTTALAPLLDRLRDDVHAAQSLRWDADAMAIYLQLPGTGAIVYQKQADRWERRTGTSDAEAEAGEITAVYRSPEKARMTVAPAEASTGELIRFQWQAEHEEPRPDRQPPGAVEILVTVGRDQRLLHE